MTTPARSVRQSIVKLVRDAFPWLAYCYPRTYVVRTAHTNGLLDLDPPPEARNELAPLNGVKVWTLGFVSVTPAAGSRVLVVFRDAQQDRPVVVAYEPQPIGSPVARAVGGGDVGFRYVQVDGSGKVIAVWWSGTAAPHASWTAWQSGTAAPVATTAGTPVDIATGSGSVKCA